MSFESLFVFQSLILNPAKSCIYRAYIFRKSIGSDSIDLYRFRPNLSLEAAIENQQASDKAKSIESDPIDSLVLLRNNSAHSTGVRFK